MMMVWDSMIDTRLRDPIEHALMRFPAFPL